MSKPAPTPPPTDRDDGLDPRLVRELVSALRRVWYGSITITIHDGAVQDVSVTDRRRLK